MKLDKPRIEPLQADQWSDEVQESVRLFSDIQQQIRDNEVQESVRPINAQQGEVPNILKTLAHHPKLMSPMAVFGNHVFKSNTLPARERELLILRIGWLCQAEYAWGQHMLVGRGAGLTDEEIHWIKAGPDAPGWDERDQLLLKATDELHTDAHISDATWQGLSRYYNTRQLMDAVFTVGLYNLVSMALNTFGVQLDAGLPTFANT